MENKSNIKTDKSVLFQISLLQGLTNGDYYGSVTINELKENGDTGIGTFDRLNGELVMLDGKVYRVAGDGSVEIVRDDETSPFAVATFIKEDVTKNLKDISDCDSLEKELEKLIEENGKNRFYMIRIDGLFRKINVRSVPAQTEPYKRLSEVLEQQQTFFEYENIKGSVVGLYCPPYMSYLNATGWHMHFISDDKTKGGHLLGVNIADARLAWNNIDEFHLILPKNDVFDKFDLTVDQSKDIEKVEKNT